LKSPLKIVVFSGAGMSAESGIQTFRAGNGLWESYNIEDVATREAWDRDPELVTSFYNERRKGVMRAKPNKAHQLIYSLEKVYSVSIITQNIDDLHERAGSKNVLHLHGNIMLSKSSGPKQEHEYFKIHKPELTENDVCPDGYRLRPHVVWFGEPVPEMDAAIEIVQQCDILIVIGTSLQVYPAASLTQFANHAKLKVLIDPNSSELSLPQDFKLINQLASEGLEEFIRKFL
jgi:NAD-dependent deacetylase